MVQGAVSVCDIYNKHSWDVFIFQGNRVFGLSNTPSEELRRKNGVVMPIWVWQFEQIGDLVN